MKGFSFSLLIISTSLFLNSCSQKNILFQNIPSTESTVQSDTSTNEITVPNTFGVNDLIQIKFLNAYDFPTGSLKTENSATYREEFRVLEDGTIVLPILGKVQIAGLSRLELIDKLTLLYKDHVGDPIIDAVQLDLTAKILGEVTRPGSYPIAHGKTHLTELIALSGGLTNFADMKQVLIIRESEKGNVDFEIDITDRKTFDLPELILKEGDTIIIRASRDKHLNEKARTYFFLTSIASVFVSVFLLIDRTR